HLDVPDEIDEEGELGHHLLEEFRSARLFCVLLDGVAYAEPRGDELAGLRPSKDPRDSARAGGAGFAAAARGARADLGVPELGNGCGELEVVKDFGVVDDVGAVEIEGGGGEDVEGCFPFGEEDAGLMSLGVAGVGTGERIERGGNHELKVA